MRQKRKTPRGQQNWDPGENEQSQTVFKRRKSEPTLRMPRLTGVDTPLNGRLVLEHRLALERDPATAKKAVTRVVFDGNEGG